MSSDSSEDSAGFATFLAGAWVSDSSSDARTSSSFLFPLHDIFCVLEQVTCYKKSSLQTKVPKIRQIKKLRKRESEREEPGRDAAAVESLSLFFFFFYGQESETSRIYEVALTEHALS